MGMNCCFVTFNGDTSQYLYSHFRDTIKFGIVYLGPLFLNGIPIEVVDYIKYLGIIMYNLSSFLDSIEYV